MPIFFNFYEGFYVVLVSRHKDVFSKLTSSGHRENTISETSLQDAFRKFKDDFHFIQNFTYSFRSKTPMGRKNYGRSDNIMQRP